MPLRGRNTKKAAVVKFLQLARSICQVFTGDPHNQARVNAGDQVIGDNPQTAGEMFGSTSRKRLADVKNSKKDKARDQGPGTNRDPEKTSHLPHNLVSDNLLRVGIAKGASDLVGSPDGSDA